MLHTCSGVPSAFLQSSDVEKKAIAFPQPPFHPVFRLQLWLREQLTKRLWTIGINVHRSGRMMGRKTQYSSLKWVIQVICLIFLTDHWQLFAYNYNYFVYLFIYSCGTLCTSPHLFYSSCDHGRVGNAVFRRKYVTDCISSSVPCNMASAL